MHRTRNSQWLVRVVVVTARATMTIGIAMLTMATPMRILMTIATMGS